MSTNNQLDDDIRFSNTDDNHKNVKRCYNEQDHKEQDCPGKKQDSKAHDYKLPAGLMIVLTYASKKASQYMTTAATFTLQLHVLAPTSLRLFDGPITNQISNDFVEKLEDLPDLNTMFGLLALMQFIGGFANFNNIHIFQATETMFFRLDTQTGLSPRVSTLDDAITAISTKQWYAQDLPVNYYIKHNSMDLIYHALRNTDQDPQKSHETRDNTGLMVGEINNTNLSTD